MVNFENGYKSERPTSAEANKSLTYQLNDIPHS